MSDFYAFVTQNPVGYAIGLLLTLIAVVKRDWGPRFGGLLVAFAWGMVSWSAVNSFKDWRISGGITIAFLGALLLMSAWLWPRKSHPEGPGSAGVVARTVPVFVNFQIDRVPASFGDGVNVIQTIEQPGLNGNVMAPARMFGPGGANAGGASLMLGYRCEIVNDGTEPLQDVQVHLPIVFFDVARRDKTTLEGIEGSARQRVSAFSIPRLDPSRQYPYIFWIINYGTAAATPDFGLRVVARSLAGEPVSVEIRHPTQRLDPLFPPLENVPIKRRPRGGQARGSQA